MGTAAQVGGPVIGFGTADRTGGLSAPASIDERAGLRASPSALPDDGVPDVIVAPDSGSRVVRLLSGGDGSELASGYPFGPDFAGGVRIAYGDVTGDGVADPIVAMGVGGGLVRLYNGTDLANFLSGYPFGSTFAGGVFVAAGDVSGDGRADVVAAQGHGGGEVRVYNAADGSLLASGFPFGPSYAGGVRVAAGDVNGDGRAEVIAAQASGGLVSVINSVDQSVLVSGFPYGADFSGGVFVAAGDVNADGRYDVILAPGTGNGPVVVVDGVTSAVLGTFPAYAPGFSGGVRVAAADLTGDGRADIITAPGGGGLPLLQVFDGATFTLTTQAFAYEPGFSGGVFVGAPPSSDRLRFTSASTTTFTIGEAGTFSITTAGVPPATSVTETGALPAGVTFTDNGDGTATLTGSPATGWTGTYSLTFTATNGVAPAATQTFTLEVVDAAPRVTVTLPADGATGMPVDSPLVVTFSELVNVTPGAFSLQCPPGTPVAVTVPTPSPATQFTIDPDIDLPATTACSLRIAADQVTDADADDPPDTLETDVMVSFTTSACAAITVSPTTLVGGTVSVAYGPVSFTQVGGAAPVIWTVTSGTLPPGLTLAADSGVLSGTPTASGAFPFTVTATAVGGCTGAEPLTLNIASGPNQAPSFAVGPNQTVAEDGGAQTVAGWATAISPGPPDEAGQTVMFNVTGNTNAALFSVAPAVSPTGTLTYTPAPNANGTATIMVVLQDNGGTALGGIDTSASQSFTITVSPTNDAPSFVVGAGPSSAEDSGSQSIPNWATSISPGPPSESAQSVTFIVTANTNPALFSAGPAVSPTGALTYTSAPNTFGTAEITLVLQDNGGADGGSVDTSAPQMFMISVTPVNDAPSVTASTITYTTVGNTQLHVAGKTLPGLTSTTDASGVLGKSGPSDADGPAAPATVPLSSVATPNGTITLDADGSFSYVPNAGFIGTDSFTVQVTDSVMPVDVTVNVMVADRVWYVNNETGPNNAAGGDGRSTDAFETLAAAETASGDNDIIFVFNGDTAATPLTGGIALKNGQKLHGEGVGLTVGALSLVPAGTRPRITAAGDTVSVLANPANGDRADVEIRGLDLTSTGNNAIHAQSELAANLGSIRISENTISGSGAGFDGIAIVSGRPATLAVHGNTITASGSGISIDSVEATLDVHGNTITASGSGIYILGRGLTMFITDFSDNVVTGNTGAGVIIDPSAMTLVVFDAIPGGALDPVSGGTTRIGQSGNGVGGPGLLLERVTGALDFVDLDIFADTGAALDVSGAFAGPASMRVSVTAGAATLVASGGPAVSLSDLTTDLQLAGLTSANSATAGVVLINVGGTFTAPDGSTITNAAGTDFNVIGGNASITYGGTITDDVGSLVTVASTTGGVKTFTGAITDGNDGDGSGISLTGNTGAAITFSGGLTLSTGANPAFTAAGGGTVTVTDPAGQAVNTIATTTGTALNVANTTIGAGGLVFQSIAANGGTNGIVLNATGPVGGLTVTGTGAGDSGGVIQNASGDAILLTNTRSISLSQVRLVNSGQSHIDATNVTGLTLNGVDTDSSADHGISGNGITNLTITGGTFHRGGANAEPACNINGVNITNLLGTSTVTGATFTRSNTIQFRVNNTSTSGSVDTLTVSGTSWNTHTGQCSGDHLSVNADTGGNFKLVTTNASGENNFETGGTGVQVAANGSGTMQASITGVQTSGNTAGVAVAATATSNIGFDVFDNNTANGTGFSGTGSVALILTCTTSGTCQGAFRNNSITHTAGTATNAMQVVVEGDGDGIVTVANNTINGNFQRGFHARVGAGTGSGDLSLHVTGNTITGTDAAGLEGVDISTSLSGDTTIVNTMCLNMANNTTTMAGGVTAYRLLSRASDVFRLQNFAGYGSAGADVQTWVTTTKSNSGTPVFVTIGAPFTTDASCPTPTLPTP